MLSTSADGPTIQTHGLKMVKKRNPVYMILAMADGGVETNEGRLKVNKGDNIAYDPISGHVWPVAASYVEQHYEEYFEEYFEDGLQG